MREVKATRTKRSKAVPTETGRTRLPYPARVRLPDECVASLATDTQLHAEDPKQSTTDGNEANVCITHTRAGKGERWSASSLWLRAQRHQRAFGTGNGVGGARDVACHI